MDAVTNHKESQLSTPNFFKNPEKLRQLRELYLRKGMGYRKIAKELHCSPTTCWNAILYYGLKEEKAGLMVGRENLPRCFQDVSILQNLEKLYDDGWPLEKLGKEFGCSESTCKRALQAVNHPLRSKKESAENFWKTRKASDTTKNKKPTTIKPEKKTGKSAEKKVKSSVSKPVSQKVSQKKTNNINIFRASLSEKDKQDLIAYYQNGESVSFLGRKYHAINIVVEVFLRENGIELREEAKKVPYKYSHLTEHEKDILFVLFSDGLDNETIMERMAITENQVKYYRRVFSNQISGRR